MNAEDFERFMKFVNATDDNGCWEWKGPQSRNGYGRFYCQGKTHPAHRILYEHYHGTIPKELDACHKCDNRICVNPNHVFPGSRSDNMLDCSAKGRNGMQRHPEKSSLIRLPKNMYVRGERQGSSRFKETDILKMYQMRHDGLSSLEIAKIYDADSGHIRRILRGECWGHLYTNFHARAAQPDQTGA